MSGFSAGGAELCSLLRELQMSRCPPSGGVLALLGGGGVLDIHQASALTTRPGGLTLPLGPPLVERWSYSPAGPLQPYPCLMLSPRLKVSCERARSAQSRCLQVWFWTSGGPVPPACALCAVSVRQVGEELLSFRSTLLSLIRALMRLWIIMPHFL